MVASQHRPCRRAPAISRAFISSVVISEKGTMNEINTSAEIGPSYKGHSYTSSLLVPKLGWMDKIFGIYHETDDMV